MKRRNNAGLNARRKRALENLKLQLEKETKTSKEKPYGQIPLTKSDKKRIKKEIAILESRIA
jgi:hypothetical protein